VGELDLDGRRVAAEGDRGRTNIGNGLPGNDSNIGNGFP
jgi:hypothetical protein